MNVQKVQTKTEATMKSISIASAEKGAMTTISSATSRNKVQRGFFISLRLEIYVS